APPRACVPPRRARGGWAGRDRRRALRGRGGREGPPVRRRGGLDQEPVPPTHPAELPRRRAHGAARRRPRRARQAARVLVGAAGLGGGDGQRMGFIVDNLVEASSPSNNPVLNPKVLKRVI